MDTTALGIPYVEAADPVVDFPSTSQALAEILEVLLRARPGNLELTDAGASIILGGDTNLYRAAGFVLQTDGVFVASQWIGAQFGNAAQTSIGDIAPFFGGAGRAGLILGSANDTALYRKAAGKIRTDGGLEVGKAMVEAIVDAAGVAGVVTPDLSLGNTFQMIIANNAAFTIANPVNPTDGQVFRFLIRNTSGGASGAITLGNKYRGELTSPIPDNTFSTKHWVYEGDSDRFYEIPYVGVAPGGGGGGN